MTPLPPPQGMRYKVDGKACAAVYGEGVTPQASTTSTPTRPVVYTFLARHLLARGLGRRVPPPALQPLVWLAAFCLPGHADALLASQLCMAFRSALCIPWAPGHMRSTALACLPPGDRDCPGPVAGKT